MLHGVCAARVSLESQRSTERFRSVKAEVLLPLGTPALMFPALGGLIRRPRGFISFGFELAAFTSLVSSEVGRRGPVGCQVAGPTRDQLRVLTVGRLARFGPGCDDGKKKKQKPQRSGCSVKLQKCYGRRKKFAVGSGKAKRPVWLQRAASRDG